MADPAFATTLDDSRFYEWPLLPGIHFPSITTIKKEGVPNLILTTWAVKKTAVLAIQRSDVLRQLEERENADS